MCSPLQFKVRSRLARLPLYVTAISLTLGLLPDPDARAGNLFPDFILPGFFLDPPSNYTSWEFSKWDYFYTPTDTVGGTTFPQNRNFPNSETLVPPPAAPAGYEVLFVGSDSFGPIGDLTGTPPGPFTYTGPFTGEYVWDVQSHADAVNSGFSGPFSALPTDPNPPMPNANFHAENPTIRQHSPAVVSASRSIYGENDPLSFTVDDSLPFTSNTVVFQFQTAGTEIDPDTILLNYNDGSLKSVAPTDLITERRTIEAGPTGFSFVTRMGAQWDLTGLGITDYTITFEAAEENCSFQDAELNTADAYVPDDGLPTKRDFTSATNDSWSTSSNWEDANGNNLLPADGANITVTGGSSLNIGNSNRNFSLLKIDTGEDFTINGTADLISNSGITASAATSPKTITVNPDMSLEEFNFFTIEENQTVICNGSLSGTGGIEKNSDGTLRLNAASTFTGGIFLGGGKIILANTTAYGSVVNELNQTFVFKGILEVEPGGTLGNNNSRVRIGIPDFESGGVDTSQLNIKGQRTISQPIDFTLGDNPKILSFSETGTGATCSTNLSMAFFVAGIPAFGIDESPPTDNAELAAINPGDSVAFTGTLTGGAADTTLFTSGGGTVIFSGVTKAYLSQTVVKDGTLHVEPSGAFTNQNNVTIRENARLQADANLTLASGKTLHVDGTLDGTGSLTLNGVTVSGSGTINKPATFNAGDTISPGSSTGPLTFGANQTWGPGTTYDWEINDTTNGPDGPFGRDRVLITGDLNITANSGSPITLNLTSLGFDQTGGAVHNWNPFDTHQWPIVTVTGSISGFDASDFAINASAITNTLPGSFTLTSDAQNIFLNYTPSGTPSPSYTSWSASLPAGFQGKLQDADFDGILNVVEFGNGGDGSSVQDGGNTNEVGIDTSTPDEPRLTITFTIADPSRPGATIEVLAGSDLTNWIPIASKVGGNSWQGPAQVTVGASTNGRTTITVTDTEIISPDAAVPRFLTVQFSSSD